MKAALRFLVILVAGGLGLVSADGLLGATRAAPPIAGAWSGGGHRLTVSGSLDGGFSVVAAESWTVIGCPIASGTVLSHYSPKGGSSYDAQYLWTENESGTCTSSTRGPETVTAVLSGNTLTIGGCGYAFCGTLSRTAPPPTTTKKTPPVTTTTPTPKPTTTAKPKPTTTPAKPKAKPKPKPATAKKKDTSPPRVQALAKGLDAPAAKAGGSVRLQFAVRDDSGKARVQIALFSGGALVGKTTSGWGPANGSTWWWDTTLPAGALGPIYFCANGVDAAGNKGKASCQWISSVVPLAKVSNGCGGGGWDTLVKIQNYFGNTHSYQDSLLHSYEVDFKTACDLHDAAYGGYTVWDPISRTYTDFHSWSRPRIDAKFLADMRTLCDRQIPASAKNALTKCHSTGGTLSIGALTLYNFVAKQGWRFFDADPQVVGDQRHGSRANF